MRHLLPALIGALILTGFARAEDVGALIAQCTLTYPDRDREGKDKMRLCMRAKGYIFRPYILLSRSDYNSSNEKRAGLSFEAASDLFERTENLCYRSHPDEPRVDVEMCYIKAGNGKEH
jgi:hypothetical protein